MSSTMSSWDAFSVRTEASLSLSSAVSISTRLLALLDQHLHAGAEPVQGGRDLGPVRVQGWPTGSRPSRARR